MAGMLGRLADEDGFNHVLDRVAGAEGFDFVGRVLDVLGTGYCIKPREREHIPVEGPLLVLANHHVDLVEPDGVRFLDFGEDPGFSGCVDGWVMLDLAMLKPAKRARYLGKSA